MHLGTLFLEGPQGLVPSTPGLRTIKEKPNACSAAVFGSNCCSFSEKMEFPVSRGVAPSGAAIDGAVCRRADVHLIAVRPTSAISESVTVSGYTRRFLTLSHVVAIPYNSVMLIYEVHMSSHLSVLTLTSCPGLLPIVPRCPVSCGRGTGGFPGQLSRGPRPTPVRAETDTRRADRVRL